MNLFNAFHSRNYRLYFFGQSVSLIGTWMQRTAMYWLVYTNTHSAFMLGLAVFAANFPSFIFSPLGGVVSDRYDRYRVLLITQIASLVQASLLTALVFDVPSTVWGIFCLSVLLGIINAFDVPARQSMVNEMIDRKEDLPNAIALNSSMVNLARLLGPAVSGIVLEEFGAATCFFINAISFVAVIASLLMMKFPVFIPQQHSKRVIHEFREGLLYLKQTPSIGLVIVLFAIISLLVLPCTTLLPVYAKHIFNGQASVFGYLNSAIGLGAVIGTIFLASLQNGVDHRKILFINLLIFGGSLAVFSHITRLPLALFFIMLVGFGMMSQTTMTTTIIQTEVSPQMRGRVISCFVMAFTGMQPLGGLFVGLASQFIGAPNTILAEGLAALVVTAAFYPFLRKGAWKEQGASPFVVDAQEASVN